MTILKKGWNKINKRKILILSLIMVGIVLLGAGTYAYYMIAIKGI